MAPGRFIIIYNLESDNSEPEPYETDEDSDYYPSDVPVNAVECENEGVENLPSTSGIHGMLFA